jgi:CRISPR system Cascade subunit CasA
MPDPSPTRYNLLTEPLLAVESPDGARSTVTLPGALARLGAGIGTEFAALQSHQLHAWHAFVVQLAALAVHADGSDDLAVDEAAWRERLRALTAGRDEPWCLVVHDLSQPAFLQAPVPEGTLAGFKRRFDSPDRLDVLVTSKNHDVKLQRVRLPQPQHWVFALVMLQTYEGFLGAGNYGIARMNGGFASRPSLGAARSPALADRLARDVAVWSARREELVSLFGYAADGGLGLVWCTPWDGIRSLPLGELDPCFIEICRRVRFVSRGALIEVVGTGSEGARVSAKELRGNTGDIWTPILKGEDAKALTVSDGGFHYSLLQDLLFEGTFTEAPAQALRPDDGVTPVVIARALARGQGETNGLHERVLPIPLRLRGWFTEPARRASLGARAKRRVELAGALRLKVLRPALCALLQAGAEQLDFTDKRPDRWTSAFDARVDAHFFPKLWEDADLDDAEADTRWIDALLHEARAVLTEARDAVPLPSMRRFRAEAAARRLFEGAARKHFPFAFPIPALNPTPTQGDAAP